MNVAAGSRIGPYEILQPLGAGGMGQVWRAHDTRLERDVALKVLPAETVGDATARARLIREARLASKLNHPHICTIYEVGESEGQAFIAMELVEGQPLSARVAHGSLPVDQIVRYGQQMADALAHAHGRCVVHRDFKSANVVVTPDGQVKVLDFGLAKRLMDEDLADATTLSRSLIAPGVVAGTLAYMAPEQLKGQGADARSDIWALGVVLYELAAGQRPFQGQTSFELTSAILSQPVPAVPPSVPASLAGVIERCLAKEPGERYQQGSEVRAALEAVASREMGAAWSPWRVVLHRRRRLLRGATAGVLALLAVAALLFGLDVGALRSRVRGGAAVSTRVVRVAVLPFANTSGDAEQEYLSDGLTTEMIALLGRLQPGTLQVIARTSVMRYKKTSKPIDQIGRELGVDYVLEGSAQREAGQLRITAELIKVADQTQLWADRYERAVTGILALQNDVAQKVATALALKLLPAEQARLAGAKAVDPEAYEAYLKGSQYWIKMTPGDVDTAQRYFEVALQKDPNYAAAYAGLAWVWACRNQMGLLPPATTVPQMQAAATKAIALDDGLAEAHYALAGFSTWSTWNPAVAEREWKRALDLDPNWAQGVAMYSHYLMIVHRPTEAMAHIERVLKLDPFNVQIHAFYTVDLLLARRFREAIAQGRATLKMQSDNAVATGGLVLALYANRQYDEAVAVAEGLYRNWHPDLADVLEKAHAESGYREAFRRLAEVETQKYGAEPGIAYDAAMNYTMAGDYARAVEWLEKAFESRDPNVPYVSVYPLLDPLRSDARFQALVRRMGLPQ